MTTESTYAAIQEEVQRILLKALEPGGVLARGGEKITLKEFILLCEEVTDRGFMPVTDELDAKDATFKLALDSAIGSIFEAMGDRFKDKDAIVTVARCEAAARKLGVSEQTIRDAYNRGVLRRSVKREETPATTGQEDPFPYHE